VGRCSFGRGWWEWGDRGLIVWRCVIDYVSLLDLSIKGLFLILTVTNPSYYYNFLVFLYRLSRSGWLFSFYDYSFLMCCSYLVFLECILE
jgi:hypothetical protein